MNKKITAALVALIVVSLFVSTWQIFQRHQVEHANRNVELAVEYGEMILAVERQGRGAYNLKEVLAHLEEKKLTSILFKEQTFMDLRMLGQLQSFQGNELLSTYRGGRSTGWITQLGAEDKLNPWHYYFEIYENNTFDRVVKHLDLKSEGLVVYQEPEGDAPGVVSTPLSANNLQELGLGFPEEAVAKLSEEYRVWLQVRHWPGATGDQIDTLFEEIFQYPLSGILFNDSDVPGFPGNVNYLARAVAELGVPVATIEFFDQKGMPSLVRSVEKEAVRLHTISQSELNTMTESRAIQRFNLAVTERNNRLLLLRTFPSSEGGEQWLERNMNYMEQLTETLEKSGYAIGPVDTFGSIPFSRLMLLVMCAGPLAGGALLVARWGLPKTGVALALLGAGLVLLLIATGRIELTRKLMALAGSIVYPTLGITLFLRSLGESSFVATVVTFLKITAVSLLGGIFTAALLADVGYLVKIDQFAGVKFAHVIPLALLGSYYGWRVFKDGGETPVQFAIRVFKQPLLVGMAAIAVIFVGILAVYVARTGNEARVVFDLELQFRALLDQILGVRPRTKEFFIGHPALLLAIFFGLRHWIAVPLILMGAIGQISVVNTYAHLHTPFAISLIRTFHGVWIGLLVGVILLVAVKVILDIYRRETAGGGN
ncbi:uncharacterized membrane protein (UPF0136 family) [Desulfitispora alkaliphila]|uniref:DUF5693 family protein n=1 Tax=Desulfitispora alkaliphila TaxID=622674 RepID=UPI003D1B9FFE